MLNKLLGGDWAPINSSATFAMLSRTVHVTGCEVQLLGTYVDEISWASGITRIFDSDASIERKARDVRGLLADAVKQLPSSPSIVHIAVETLDGPNVEDRRIEKLLRSIPEFMSENKIVGVRLHLFQANQTIDKLFEIDETIEKFQEEGADLRDIPSRVVVPTSAALSVGRHWEIYR